jgi:hypothetical protein
MVSHENNRLADYAAEPAHMVQEYPLSSALVVFGVGLGTGLLLSSLLAEPVRMAVHQETTSERMRRQLMDAFHSVMPSVLERFTA